jgi:hypothetical protein
MSLHVKAVDARYHENCMRVLLPLDVAEQWAASDQISLSLQREHNSGPSVLVEKDFQCLNCDA